MKPRFYGEALIVDDVYQSLGWAEEEHQKEETRKRKARSSTRLTGSKVAPVYIGSAIIVLVLQVSQMDFGLAPIVTKLPHHQKKI